MFLGKIGVKEELVKREVQLNSSLLCVLCNLGQETCNHFFVECMDIWKIWSGWCKSWGVTWTFLETVKSCF
ncbi:Uncharacterized protein TCM_037957 [Theobroma cacao]|uniref:Reverse transcriptase zinc-binding domain-containing protein n=1 Tax=Theobroma cacao TaxID=3641 RepID=A0A061GND0_THECC|nr:Uncharacterized protein TCM_037957 [Theobroma cacao]